MNSKGLHSRYIKVDDSSADVVLTFEPSSALTFGSARLAKDVLWRVTSKIRGAKPLAVGIEGGRVQATFAEADRSRLPYLLTAIDAILDAFTKAPLHPRVVEEILGISSRERLRWTKDGRLKRSGSGSFRSGSQRINFQLYPVQQIVELAENSEIVSAWRAADAAGIASVRE